MCHFFSFISDGNGKTYYFNAKQRKEIEEADSHSKIAYYYKINKPSNEQRYDDIVNKYEYFNGEFKIDQININNDSKIVNKWIDKFKDSKKFQKICLAAVKQNGWALQYVKEQTKEICLAAVKQNGLSLEYVKKQTKDICLAAVKRNGHALEYVKKQTKEICLEAVKQDGRALQCVIDQTEDICLAAVKRNGHALEYVKKQTKDICLEAVKRNGHALEYVKKQTKDICLAAVKQNKEASRFVKNKLGGQLSLPAKQIGRILQHIKEQFRNLLK